MWSFDRPARVRSEELDKQCSTRCNAAHALEPTQEARSALCTDTCTWQKPDDHVGLAH